MPRPFSVFQRMDGVLYNASIFEEILNADFTRYKKKFACLMGHILTRNSPLPIEINKKDQHHLRYAGLANLTDAGQPELSSGMSTYHPARW